MRPKRNRYARRAAWLLACGLTWLLVACQGEVPTPSPSIAIAPATGTLAPTRVLATTVPTLTPARVIRSQTPLPPSKTSTPTAAITMTPYPPEMLSFIQGGGDPPYAVRRIVFIDSDGKNSEDVEFFAPFESGETRQISWSKDGHYLAFDGSNQIKPCGITGTDCVITNYALFITAYPDDEPFKVSSYSYSWGRPSWFGTDLVISAPFQGGVAVFTIDVVTGSKKQISPGEFSDLYPSWSPDGQWIAYVQYITPDENPNCDDSVEPEWFSGCHHGRLFLVRPDGSDSKNLVEKVFIEADVDMRFKPFSNPAWSPDSRHLAVLVGKEDPDIAIIDIVTSKVQVIAESPYREVEPVWSPDGKRLAFVTDRDGNEEIYTIDLASRELVNLTRNPATDYGPVWSFTGRFIAFISGLSSDSLELHVMTAEGNNIKQLGNYGIMGRPAWIPALGP